jgi:hypothetical protein
LPFAMEQQEEEVSATFKPEPSVPLLPESRTYGKPLVETINYKP